MLPFSAPLALRPSRQISETQFQQHAAFQSAQTYHMSALPTRGGRPQQQLSPVPTAPQGLEESDSLFVPQATITTTSSGRMLNADGSRPDTFCHAASHLRTQPHYHKLRCGHEVFTVQIKACGGNCEVLPGSILPSGLNFSCPDRHCKRKASQANPFIPSKTAKPKMIWTCTISTVTGADEEAEQERKAKVAVARMPKAAKKQIDNLKFDKPGPKTLEEFLGATLRAGRDRSRSPGQDEAMGYRTREYERSTRKPQRHTTRTLKLEKMKADCLVDNEMPHSYAQAPNRSQAQHDHAGFHSVTEEAFDSIQQARDGVAMPVKREEELQDQVMAELEDLDGGRQVKLEFDYQPTHCICESGSSGTLVECTACHFFFHPVCVGKGVQDSRSYEGATAFRARMNDAEHYSIDKDFRCRECDAADAAVIQKTLTWEEMQAEKTRVKRLFKAKRVADKAMNSQHNCGVCDVVITRWAYRCGMCTTDFVICSACSKDPYKSSKHRHAAHSGLY